MPRKNEQNSVWEALSLAWELGYMIALPIVLFGFSGAYLDKNYGGHHWFLIAGIALSVLISSIAVYRRVKNIS